MNAYAGAGKPLRGALATNVAKWSLKSAPIGIEKFLKPPPPADPKDWLDARVGWALVAFERDGFNAQQYATNEDLCAPLRDLLEKRENTLVLRFRPGSDQRFTLLRDYRNGRQLDIAGSPVGKANGSLPRYLLLVGKPTQQQLPWSLQYLLSVNRYVGRLPFDPLHDEALLSPYIHACLNDWSDAQCDTDATLTWAVDHDPEDITHVMRRSIADAVYEKFAADADLQLKSIRLTDDQATHAELHARLSATSPAMIVTTSHGMTGPIDDAAAMAAQLGVPVDCQHQPMPVEALLKAWNPSGAIWYAHACCAAGSDDGSRFDTLLEAGSDAQQTLVAVGKLGARAAPLPLALLAAAKPVRAFVGHVEPTFDWTLKQPATGQLLTSTLIGALYDELYLGSPVGHAFRNWYAAAGTHYAAWDATKQAFDGKEAATASLLYHNLAARDIQTLVLLGDPVVRLKA
ncbi:MAG TPA: hypothetical protein VIT67_21220 [Povalibacter sp.]